MALSADEAAALQAYSEGKLGWRAACKSLSLIDHRELHDLLEEHNLPEPEVDDQPLDEDTVARFNALLRGEA